MKIAELSLTDTAGDLENLIVSALSGDISLFEKISSSGYRLRIHAAVKECEDNQSDSEDIGSGDDISEVTGGNDANDSEHESRDSSLSKTCVSNSINNVLTLNDEIDESHPGESWLLGLMEGEYSDLSIEEKLNALIALIDLLRAASSITMEVATLIVCLAPFFFGIIMQYIIWSIRWLSYSSFRSLVSNFLFVTHVMLFCDT